MQVDISAIVKINGASLDISFEEPLTNKKDLIDDCLFDSALSFKGTIANTNGILQLEGKLDTNYKTACYRCLKETNGHIEIFIKENFTKSGKATEEIDAYEYEGNVIDLEKAVTDNIVLNLPMKQLCSFKCKGLCQVCGKNLNEETCNCEKEIFSPQLEKLSNFFNN